MKALTFTSFIAARTQVAIMHQMGFMHARVLPTQSHVYTVVQS